MLTVKDLVKYAIYLIVQTTRNETPEKNPEAIISLIEILRFLTSNSFNLNDPQKFSEQFIQDLEEPLRGGKFEQYFDSILTNALEITIKNLDPIIIEVRIFWESVYVDDTIFTTLAQTQSSFPEVIRELVAKFPKDFTMVQHEFLVSYALLLILLDKLNVTTNILAELFSEETLRKVKSIFQQKAVNHRALVELEWDSFFYAPICRKLKPQNNFKDPERPILKKNDDLSKTRTLPPQLSCQEIIDNFFTNHAQNIDNILLFEISNFSNALKQETDKKKLKDYYNNLSKNIALPLIDFLKDNKTNSSVFNTIFFIIDILYDLEDRIEEFHSKSAGLSVLVELLTSCLPYEDTPFNCSLYTTLLQWFSYFYWLYATESPGGRCDDFNPLQGFIIYILERLSEKINNQPQQHLPELIDAILTFPFEAIREICTTDYLKNLPGITEKITSKYYTAECLEFFDEENGLFMPLTRMPDNNSLLETILNEKKALFSDHPLAREILIQKTYNTPYINETKKFLKTLSFPSSQTKTFSISPHIKPRENFDNANIIRLTPNDISTSGNNNNLKKDYTPEREAFFGNDAIFYDILLVDEALLKDILNQSKDLFENDLAARQKLNEYSSLPTIENFLNSLKLPVTRVLFPDEPKTMFPNTNNKNINLEKKSQFNISSNFFPSDDEKKTHFFDSPENVFVHSLLSDDKPKEETNAENNLIDYTDNDVENYSYEDQDNDNSHDNSSDSSSSLKSAKSI